MHVSPLKSNVCRKGLKIEEFFWKMSEISEKCSHKTSSKNYGLSIALHNDDLIRQQFWMCGLLLSFWWIFIWLVLIARQSHSILVSWKLLHGLNVLMAIKLHSGTTPITITVIILIMVKHAATILLEL